MKFIITVLASVSLSDLFIWWSSARILHRFGAPRSYRIIMHCFMAFQVFAQLFIIFGRVKGLNVDEILPSPLMIATFIWHLTLVPFMLVLNSVLLLHEAVTAGWRFIQRRRAAKAPAAAQEALTATPPAAHAATPEEATPVPAESPKEETSFLPVSRRQFIAATVALAPPLVNIISSTIASQQIQNFRIRRITIPSPQLPKELDGMTIAHISDTHVGRFSNGKVLHKIADATNELKADVVAVTGDILNDSLRWMPEAIEMLERIDSPVYLCEGNHDLIDDAFEFRAQIKRLPERFLLVDETRTTHIRRVPIQLLGLSWAGPRRSREKEYRDEFTLGKLTEQLMRRRNPELFQIMLAHHPHAWDHTPEIPLTLAGHTHGGQIMLNEELGFGPMIFRYWTGLYTREATARAPQSSLVVSNGAGNWFPLRIAAPAEIVHITLKSV